MRTTDYRSFLSLLRTGGVRFIIVGGVAGNIRGAARATFDLDLVYARDREDIRRLVDALKPHSPYLRGAPPGLPFTFDERTVRNGLNFTLTTSLGDLDLLGEVAGGGTYEQLLPFTSEVHAFGVTCPCVTPRTPHPAQARRRPPEGLRGHRRVAGDFGGAHEHGHELILPA